nr:hypothetical protein [Acidobacteriota bacterium]
MEGWVVLIPIVAILSGTVREWIKVSARQRDLGTSTHELEKDVTELRQDRTALLERIQNLETIVVSQTWGVLQDKGLSPAAQEI